MQSTVFFTSITPNYLAKAKVLYKTLKHFNPGAFFVLGICDSKVLELDILREPFDDVLKFESLEKISNKKQFLFKHTITELCTALKPFYAEAIVNKYRASKVIYLDPDIVVSNTLDPIISLLDHHSILLTPHQLAPEEDDLYVKENEILFLKRGSYNLGFFAVKTDNQGLEFINWWQNRLNYYCFDDDYETLPELSSNQLLGLFTDQKWIDLVPCFFSSHYIIRDPGYNVCTWNLSNRHVELLNDGSYSVNGFPMRFFHFSGYDSGGHHNELLKSLQYYPNNNDVIKLSSWYGDQIKQEGQDYYGNIPFSMTKYDNGVNIQNFERKLFHIRKDIHNIFTNPFKVSTNEPCFYNWVRIEYDEYFDKPEINENRKLDIQLHEMFNRWFPIGSKRRSITISLIRTIFRRH